MLTKIHGNSIIHWITNQGQVEKSQFKAMSWAAAAKIWQQKSESL